MNIQVELGQKVEQVEEKNGSFTITTSSGHVYQADAYIKAMGITINSAPIQSLGQNMLDDRGCIKVNEFLQVPSHPHIFCAGDVCNADSKKLYYLAAAQAAVAAENIINTIQGKGKLSKYSPDTTNLCVIP